MYDASTYTVYAHPIDQLAPGTSYTLRVGAAHTTFTTLSATDGLSDMRDQLDSGRAFAAAGIPPAARTLRVDAVVPAAGTTLTYGDGIITGTRGRVHTPAAGAGRPGGSRDGLRQTAADIMTLVRDIARGVDLNSDGVPDLQTIGTDYYGQMSTFLASGGRTIIDPDGAAPVWQLARDYPGMAETMQ